MERAPEDRPRGSERLAKASLRMALFLFLLGVNWPALLGLPQPGAWFQQGVYWTWIALTVAQAICVFNALLLAGDESRGKGLALASLSLSGLCLGIGTCLGALAFCLGIPLVLAVCAGQLFIAAQVARRENAEAGGTGGWTLLAWLAVLATPLLGGLGVLGSLPRLY